MAFNIGNRWQGNQAAPEIVADWLAHAGLLASEIQNVINHLKSIAQLMPKGDQLTDLCFVRADDYASG